MKVIHETEVVEKAVPGRFLRWIADKGVGLDPEYLSCCVMRVQPGETVRPAHCHPNGEELIYVIRGAGQVYVDGTIAPVREGSAVLFEKGSIHMVRNSGEEEMKVICVFAPPSNLDEYEFHPEVDFNEGRPL